MLFEDMLLNHLTIAKERQLSNSKMFDEIGGKDSSVWSKLSEGDSVRVETIEVILKAYLAYIGDNDET